MTLPVPNSPPSHAIRPTFARVDLLALTQNFRVLRETLSSPHREGAARREVAMIAVVKADAYGHGAVPVARILEGAGVWGFGVATVEEGVELRDAGIRAPILVMGAAFGDAHEAVLAYDLTPVVGDPGDIDRFAEVARAADRLRFSIHVKIDTGMSRLGITPPGFEAFLRRCARYPWIRVDGLATHLHSAEDADPDSSEAQLQAFVRCLDAARALGADPQMIHVGNTAGALRFPHAHFDAVRVGIGLYGELPSAHVPDPGLTPVLSWRTRINALRDLPAGTSVSYGSTFVTRRPSRIATLPVGYADGYARRLGNRASVLLDGQRAPVVGRVCMDLCMVDVTDVPGVAVGDTVTLLGGDGRATIGAGELARWAETIPYEVWVGISKRVPRRYPGISPSEAALAGGRR
ncbi:MAG: alanine racemase [Deltaproteobacteria bacterium]|nr:alanine racemase [Deltaproteobacteria bacterium]